MLDLKTELQRVLNIVPDQQEIKFAWRELRNAEIIKRSLRQLKPNEDIANSDLSITFLKQGEFFGFIQFFSRKDGEKLSTSARLVPKSTTGVDLKRHYEGDENVVPAKRYVNGHFKDRVWALPSLYF